MTEPRTPSADPPNTRSGAIYTSAHGIYKLIEDEIAFAIKPYQDALEALKQQLGTQASAISAEQATQAALTMSALQARQDFDALKRTLDESGIGVVIDVDSGQPSLCFVGDTGNVMSTVNSELSRFARSPEDSKPISPATIVTVLMQVFAQCKEWLATADAKHSSLLTERDDLAKTLAERDSTIQTDTSARSQLETSLTEEQKKVVALTNALATIRTAVQKTAVEQVSLRAEAGDWKTKYHTMVTERDTWKTTSEDREEKLVAAMADLNLWKSKHLEAETDLNAARNESARELGKMQAEVDDWRTKCLALETVLKNAADETDSRTQASRTETETRLATIQSELDSWKDKALAAEKERDDAQSALREANAEAIDLAKTAETNLEAWTTKATTWDAERNRHKSQSARNAALITTLQSDVTKLEAKLHAAEAERDRLRETLREDNEQALNKNKALTADIEDLKKKVVAATGSKTPTTMFIKPRGSRPTDKPASPTIASPRVPASANVSPLSAPASKPPPRRTASTPSGSSPTIPADPPSALGPIVGIQNGVPIRRNTGATRASAEASTSKTTPRKAAAPPRPVPVPVPDSGGGGETLRGSPSLTRASPRGTAVRRDSEAPARSTASASSSPSTAPRASTSKRPAEDASRPPNSKRPALSTQSNASLSSTLKAASDPSLKRSAPSPLGTEREKKIPRSSASSSASASAAPAAASVPDTQSLRFTKPPTAIATPAHPSRVPAPPPVPAAFQHRPPPPTGTRRPKPS